jgi:hypothetical protein
MDMDDEEITDDDSSEIEENEEQIILSEDAVIDDADEGDGNEDNEDEVLAAVVVDDDDDGVDTVGSEDDESMAVVEAVAVKSEERKNISSPKRAVVTNRRVDTDLASRSSKRGNKGRKSPGLDEGSPPSKKLKKTVNSISKIKTDSKLKCGNTASIDIGSGSNRMTEEDLYKNVSPAVIEAANDARRMLRETIRVIPFPIAETVIRSLGRLCVQVRSSKSNQKDRVVQNKFCLSSALYPIGFSCDRNEFSPVHGRVLKLRCSILDGRSVKVKQKELLQRLDPKETATSKASISDIHDGPIFRITWGRGVDEASEIFTEKYPYDPEIHSSPLFVNSIGRPKRILSKARKGKYIRPAKGMRAKVRIDRDSCSDAKIIEVSSIGKSNGNGKTRDNIAIENSESQPSLNVTVLYDYGTTETFEYPDPDLEIIMPGMLKTDSKTVHNYKRFSYNSRSF